MRMDDVTKSQLQGDPPGWLKPAVDLVLTVMAAGGPVLQVPTAWAGWRNIPNPRQREILTTRIGHHPVVMHSFTNSYSGRGRAGPEVQELRLCWVGHEGPAHPRDPPAQEQGHQVPSLRLLHLSKGS